MSLTDTDLKLYDWDSILSLAQARAFDAPRWARELQEIGRGERGPRPPRPAVGGGFELHVPQDVLDRRSLYGGDVTAGGAFIATEHLSPLSFSAARYAASVLGPAGVTYIPLRAGDGEVPTVGKITTSWVGTEEELTESTPTTGLVNFIMRTVGAHVDVERRLIKSGAGAILFPELARALGEAEETAALQGLGYARQPLGLIYADAIPVASLGTNGAVPSYDDLLDLTGEPLNNNAPRGSLGFVTSATMRETLSRQTVNPAGGEAFIWQPAQRPDADGSVATYPSWATTCCPANLTKGTSAGVCSAIVFGAWSDLAVARWGGVDLIVDPFSLAQSGLVRVSVYSDVDVVVTRPESFAMILDALTY